MQRKRRNINFGYFSGSSGKSKLNNSITKSTLHSIPTVRMSESNKKSLIAERNPFCGINELYTNDDADIYQHTSVVWWRSRKAPLRVFHVRCFGKVRVNSTFLSLPRVFRIPSLRFGAVIRTRASHVVMTPLSRLARYPKYIRKHIPFGGIKRSSEFENAQSSRKMTPYDEMQRYFKAATFGFLLLTISIITSLIMYPEQCLAKPVTLPGTAQDSGTISTLTGGTNPGTPTASLSLSKPNMTSDAVMPGSTATTSTNVTVNVSNAKSYELYLKVNKATMTNGSTTITAGNVITDNTWGYKWDNASSYAAPSTSNSKLTTPALDNYGTSFTKALSFGAKFASNANPGHYTASGTLSLIATPRDIIYTLDDLAQMQQLSLAPSACANTPYLDGQTYSKEYTLTDVRDGNTYTVRKFGDGRCWMTENLRLSTIVGDSQYTEGRLLNPTTSDVTTNYTLPPMLITLSSTDFSSSNYYIAQSYNASSPNSGNTMYYSWTAATAGAGASSSLTSGSVDTSICPKGWTLPSGGSNGEFQKFATAESITSNAAGSTKIQAAPYNFKYTGLINNGSLGDGTFSGHWWSSTVASDVGAYDLYISNSYVFPYELNDGRCYGFAVRCVARDS